MCARTLRFCLIFFGQLLVAQLLHAQDPELANQYFGNGEYEKAASVYSQLLEKDGRNEYYFNRYIDCLVSLEQYDDAEKAVKRQLKRSPDNVGLYVTFGNLYDKQGKSKEAKDQYEAAIAKMAPDFNAVTRLASLFVSNQKYDFAIQTYERGAQVFNDPNRFAFNLGELYRRKGETEKMVEQYLNALSTDPSRLAHIQTMLSRYLAPADYTTLQSQIYDRMQRSGENPDLIELLAWSFVQRKDYKGALRQYKALDKRLEESGQRVFNLALNAAESRDYETAIAAFDYIINEKGPNSPFFFEAKREGMNTRRKKITEGFAYTEAELRGLEAEYNAFLNQYGRNKQTADLILELAELEALYINDLPQSIALLDSLIHTPGLDRNTLARTKIDLGDYYLIHGDIWESTLLYSQVDKDFKEEQLGQEARFKNARLSYFNGDFQWSQAQFDILKASTSKLISNDALDLSVFIMDNLNLDTTSEAISLYSGAELMVYQNRFPEAFAKLDSLRKMFPEHSLQDDILYLEAQIFEKKRDYNKAVELYQQVLEKFPQDIRADNALFSMAQLYETQLHNPDKAKELYEKVFVDYSGSVYAVEARKRFRILRGDKIQG